MTRAPAQIQPYVDVLGEERTVAFLLEFGGAEMYLTTNPKGRSKLAELFGIEVAAALARSAEYLPRRVPTAKAWVAQALKRQGLSVADIARKLHMSDVAVRGHLKRDPGGSQRPDNPAQLRLF